MTNPIRIPLRRGDTSSRTFVLKDSNGAAIDLTGSTMTMNVRTDKLNGYLPLSSGHGLTVSAADGKVTFVLTEDQTKQLKRGFSEFELKRRTDDGQWTLVTGAFEISEAIRTDD